MSRKDTPHTPLAELTREQQRQGRGYPKSCSYPHRHGYFRDNVALVVLGSLLGLTPRRPTELPELDNLAALVCFQSLEEGSGFQFPIGGLCVRQVSAVYFCFGFKPVDRHEINRAFWGRWGCFQTLSFGF